MKLPRRPRPAPRPGVSPRPETPYRRHYTADRSFEELVRRAREEKKPKK
ncbi:MAG: hypothetical protein ACI4OL_07980 [Gemmiger sp.]